MNKNSEISYTQETKNTSRLIVLQEAVDMVTNRRRSITVVSRNHVRRVKNKLMEGEFSGDRDAAYVCTDSDISSWEGFYDETVGKRTASDISVAYLAGPEPTNDINILIELGVKAENIWAFEINRDAIIDGLADLQKLAKRGVKFITVSMEAYFISTPKRFDIIYFDSCGPLPSKDQKTTRVLSSIFRNSALSSIGVLITNFSMPDIRKENDLNKFSYLISSYLYPKNFIEYPNEGTREGPPSYGYDFMKSDDIDDIDDKIFYNEVRDKFDFYYGSFITRHIFDMSSIISPSSRLFNGNLLKVISNEKIDDLSERGRRFIKVNKDWLIDIEKKEDNTDIPMDHEAIEFPDHYSLLWTFAACGFYESDGAFDKPDRPVQKFLNSWRNQIPGFPDSKIPGEKLISSYYAIRHDTSLWSPSMKKVSDFPYRSKMPSLCDVPTCEIGFYPAFAQLSYPMHPNIKETKRYRYKAEGKNTEMFLDVIPFDECRYVYDWLSALHLFQDDWSNISTQMTFRFALDGIAKALSLYFNDFLYGVHVVGINRGFPQNELTPRTKIYSFIKIYYEYLLMKIKYNID